MSNEEILKEIHRLKEEIAYGSAISTTAIDAAIVIMALQDILIERLLERKAA